MHSPVVALIKMKNEGMAFGAGGGRRVATRKSVPHGFTSLIRR